MFQTMPFGIAGAPPAMKVANRLVAAAVRAALVEVIHKMHHRVGRAALPREAVMLLVEHLPVESESWFHRG